MSNIGYIVKKANSYVKKYSTRDPFELCSVLNISVRFMELGESIKAYFFYQSRIRNIVINQNADAILVNILCAHELAHAVLHRKSSTVYGFKELGVFDRNDTAEYEANLFAAEILIDDDELMTLLKKEYSIYEAAAELQLPYQLIEFKLHGMKHKGIEIDIPRISRADFLKDI